MVEFKKISIFLALCFTFVSVFAQLQIISPDTVSDFKIIGIYTIKNLAIVTKIDNSFNVFRFRKMSCSSLYVVDYSEMKNLNKIIHRRIETNPNSHIYRLVHDDAFIWSLIKENPWGRGQMIKDSLLIQYLSNNTSYLYRNLYDSIQNFDSIITQGKNYRVRKLINTDCFLLVQMNLAEFYKILPPNCLCKGDIDLWGKNQLILRAKKKIIKVIIPINRDKLKKYPELLKKYEM
jgi:hypothetical protein